MEGRHRGGTVLPPFSLASHPLPVFCEQHQASDPQTSLSWFGYLRGGTFFCAQVC